MGRGISNFQPRRVEENNIVYGRFYRCVERRQERPVIILLDGIDI